MTPTILRHIRENFGLTRAELAAEIGYKPEYIRHIEMGRKTPSKRFEMLLSGWVERTEREATIHPIEKKDVVPLVIVP